MPRDLDDTEIQDLESSAISATLDDAGADKADAQAAPSTADGATKEADTLSVVRDVVDARAATKAASPAEGDEVEGQQPGVSVSKKDPDDENYTDVPFHKHPRFQHLMRRAKSLEVDAGRYRNVETFLSNAGLGADEAADALRIAGMAKINPAQAWEEIKPWVTSLLVAAGEVLPNDLSQRVQKGELPQAAAIELSKARAGQASMEHARQFEETQRTTRAQQEAASAVTNTVEAWETDRRIKDPNYAAKEVPLQKEIAFLHRTEGVPRTPDAVREQLNRAYKAVNEQVRAATPQPLARTRPAVIPVRGGQVNVGATAQAPKTTLELVQSMRRAAR